MPKRPINHHFYRHYSGVQRTRGHTSQKWWVQQLNRGVEVRTLVLPASVSNPVRPGRGRAQGSYSADSRFQLSSWASAKGGIPGSSQWEAEGNLLYRTTGVDTRLSQRFLVDSRNKALAGMSESKRQFNVAARELKDTMQSLTEYYRHASKGVRSMFKDFPKATQERLKHTPPYNWREVPSDYLGYLYGIAPIAEDVTNGCDQLTGRSKEGMAYGYEVKAGMVREEQVEFELNRVGSWGPASFSAIGTRTSFARVGYKYLFPKWWIDNVPVLSPFSEAWELTRLSFVADWVLPCGNWIGAMESAQFDPYFQEGFELYGAIEVVKAGGVVIDHPSTPSDWQTSFVPPDGGFRMRQLLFQRVALSRETGTSPFGQVRFPDFRAEMGVSQAAQAASLFAQRFYKPPVSWFRSKD